MGENHCFTPAAVTTSISSETASARNTDVKQKYEGIMIIFFLANGISLENSENPSKTIMNSLHY